MIQCPCGLVTVSYEQDVLVEQIRARIERQLESETQNIPQEIIDRYNSVHTNSKKMEDIAYE